MAESMVRTNGVDLCVETFGAPDAAAILLIAGAAASMDWWDADLCRRLAAGGRLVIRYDHRDTGRSVSYPPGRPGYTGSDPPLDGGRSRAGDPAHRWKDRLEQGRAALGGTGFDEDRQG